MTAETDRGRISPGVVVMQWDTPLLAGCGDDAQRPASDPSTQVTRITTAPVQTRTVQRWRPR